MKKKELKEQVKQLKEVNEALRKEIADLEFLLKMLRMNQTYTPPFIPYYYWDFPSTGDPIDPPPIITCYLVKRSDT